MGEDASRFLNSRLRPSLHFRGINRGWRMGNRAHHTMTCAQTQAQRKRWEQPED